MLINDIEYLFFELTKYRTYRYVRSNNIGNIKWFISNSINSIVLSELTELEYGLQAELESFFVNDITYS